MKRAEKRSVPSLRQPSRWPSAARRGFTLVELLITVAMIGVLAALALVGYRRFIHASQSSEAKSVIQMIRGGEEAYKSEMLVYLSPSHSLTDWYPNTAPNDSRMTWSQSGDTRYTDSNQGWALLNVNPDAPVRFGYVAMAGIGNPMTQPSVMSSPPTMPVLPAGVPWYIVQAENDHDNNGIFAVFCSSSVSSEILSENEQE
jgi:type IV pilus assembly protein PilA